MPEKKSCKWAKQVLLAGFFIQFFLAYIIFIFLKDVPLLLELKEQARLGIILLSSLMLATPLGFLAANFIFYYINFLTKEIKDVIEYKETQLLLLKVLFLCFLFLILISAVILFLF